MPSGASSGKNGVKVARRAGTALAVFCLLAAALYLADATNRYLWIKALHIIAVMSWMAGLLYMPRLFIYHLDQEEGSPASETFKLMERRLLRVIMYPAMVLAWVFGLWLAISIYGFHGGWLHLKLLMVLCLTGSHFYMARAVRAFGRDERIGNARFWRFFNEVPTILMIVIVILAVLKPFS